MKPPFSVIFLTTLIGIGQGLFLALYTGQLYSFFGLLPVQDSRTFYAMGSALSLVFLGVGLFASFFHLMVFAEFNNWQVPVKPVGYAV